LRPFLEITAVPEPSTPALLLGSLGLVGWVSRRRPAAWGGVARRRCRAMGQAVAQSVAQSGRLSAGRGP